MTTDKSAYVEFYLMGSEAMEEDGVDVDDVDLAPSIERIMKGDDVYAVAVDVATKVMAPYYLRDKVAFDAENAEYIKELEIDGTEAFSSWMKGRTDELRRSIEKELMEGIAEDMGDEDEDDEDEGDEDDE